jgi:hypothetical protein
LTIRLLTYPLFAIATLISAGLALISYRYLWQDGPIPPVIEGNRFLVPWLVIHVVGAATALLVGPAQLRKRRFTALPQKSS